MRNSFDLDFDLDLDRYRTEGYAIAHGLFSADEVRAYLQHYMAMRERDTLADNTDNASLNDVSSISANDPLKTWPRLMQMHLRDETSLRFLLDERLKQALTALMQREPYAVQTMMYFKPPGARGQALHQDQYYLRVQPGTCVAAWLALDDCDEDNGCLKVVPGSHTGPLLCTIPANTHESFTDITVPLTEGVRAVPVRLKAGDVMFFNGQLIHGSDPNITQTRFRRSLIAHYIAGEAQQVYKWYRPVLQMDGTPVELATSEIGGQCGTWVTRSGEAVLELVPEIPNQQIFGPH